jgi:branched-subunit amino acid transport protein
MNEAVWIAGMALVTFAVRYPVLLLVGRAPLPQAVLRALKYVPPAVLTAIVAPAVLLGADGGLHIGLDNAFLAAALAATLVAWRTRNVLLTIVIGMAVLWAWRWLTGMR